MALLLWLYLLAAPKLISFWSVGPRIIPSDVQGHASKPLVILVRTELECRGVGISVDGPKSYTAVKAAEPGRTLRIEYPNLTSGHYVIYLACLDAGERILQLVDAGSADVL